ncbi:MAG: Gfo/Idh/MocA family protein [Chloroflexota bacterium]
MHLAFYGAGAIAERHLDAIRRTGALDVTWLVSRTEEHVQALAMKTEIVQSTTDENLPLADPDVEAVVIAYPTFRHADLALRAFAAGKHVVCEKPLASTTSEAEQIAAAARQADKLLLVMQIRRFWPAFQAARAFVASGEAGGLVRATVDFQTEWDWSKRGWRLEEAGGYLLDMHVHDLDLLLWYAGHPPERVWASGENRAEREGTVVLEFATSLARLDWSGRISGRPYPIGARTCYQVACERGRLEIEIAGDVTVDSFIDGKALEQQRSVVGDQIRASWDGMWSAQAAALLGHGPLPVPPEAGILNVRVSMAAVEALQSHAVQRI